MLRQLGVDSGTRNGYTSYHRYSTAPAAGTAMASIPIATGGHAASVLALNAVGTARRGCVCSSAHRWSLSCRGTVAPAPSDKARETARHEDDEENQDEADRDQVVDDPDEAERLVQAV